MKSILCPVCKSQANYAGFGIYICKCQTLYKVVSKKLYVCDSKGKWKKYYTDEKNETKDVKKDGLPF